MVDFRPTSPRPTVLLDRAGFPLADPNQGVLGLTGPFGRERILSCLPFNDGPRLLAPDTVIVDRGGFPLRDPAEALIGVPAVRVSRMLSAEWVEDTRRLAS